MASDPSDRVAHDYYLGELEEPLIDRDGDEARKHSAEEWYFGEYQCNEWSGLRLEGPLLDMGADAGRDTFYSQEQFETIAIEVSEYFVETMQDRGVDDAYPANMSSLRGHLGRNRFQSASALGTQARLAGSVHGLRQLLDDPAFVTAEGVTAILHGYAPELEVTEDIFAYWEDPTPGLVYWIFHCEYDGEIGRALLLQLFNMDRLGEVTVGML